MAETIAPATQKCALCGAEFDARSQGCRPGCPMGHGCGMVCCPRCGYGFPQVTQLAARSRALNLMTHLGMPDSYKVG